MSKIKFPAMIWFFWLVSLFWLPAIILCKAAQAANMQTKDDNGQNSNSGTNSRIITLEEKAELITTFQSQYGPVFPLESVQMSQLLSYPRNYTMITLMNIDDSKYDCPQCIVAAQAFAQLAEAFTRQYPLNKKNDDTKGEDCVIFTTMNYFKNGQQAFEAVTAIYFVIY